MFCHSCGTELEDGSLFCSECGVRQETEPYEEPAPAVTPRPEPYETQGSAAQYEEPVRQEEAYYEEPARQEEAHYQEPAAQQGEGEYLYCPHCGTRMPAEENVCPQCLTYVKEYVVNGEETVTLGPWTVTKRKYQEIQKRDRAIMWFAHGAIILCLIIAIWPLIFKHTINLNKYVSFESQGYDGYGEVITVFDYERFNNDYEARFKADSKNKISLFGIGGSYEHERHPSDLLGRCARGTIDKGENISNGDEVVFNWEFDAESVMRDYGYRLSYSPVTYKVEGLQTPQEYDPFEGLTIMVDGENGWGEAWIESSDTVSIPDIFNYYLDQNYELSNGDIITMYVVPYWNYYDDPVEYAVREYGLKPTRIEKQVKVAGLQE